MPSAGRAGTKANASTGMKPFAPGLSCGRPGSNRARQIAHGFQREEAAFAGDRLRRMLCRPRDVIRNMHPGAAEFDHGKNIRFQRVAYHEKSLRIDVMAREDFLV